MKILYQISFTAQCPTQRKINPNFRLGIAPLIYLSFVKNLVVTKINFDKSALNLCMP